MLIKKVGILDVKFTNDWRKDALRRDFTMNAMYLFQAMEHYMIILMDKVI